MKYIFTIFILCFFTGCAISVIKDNFDGSNLIKLERDITDFNIISGTLEIVYINFTREQKANKTIGPLTLYCKFEGEKGEVLEGKEIEVKVDNKIFRLKLNEARLQKNDQTSTIAVTIIDGFTVADSENTSIHYIATESTVSKEITDAMKVAESITFRIMTKNIDGVAKNTFECSSSTVNKIKDLINYQFE